MKSGLPIIVTAIMQGSIFHFVLFVALVLSSVVMTILGVRKQIRREPHRFSGALLYLCGVAFLLGLIKGSWAGMDWWHHHDDGIAVQSNPIFIFLAGILTYSTVALLALIGSIITRVPNKASVAIGADAPQQQR